MFDLRFKNPSAFLLAGASQSGKTTFVLKMLKVVDLVFENPQCKNNIIYFYNQWQPSFDIYKEENEDIVKEWINKLPSTEDIAEKTLGFAETGSIIIIDDFAQQLNKDTVEIFTRQCHHTNSVLILLAQNIFCKNPVFREISLNATYVLLFKNPRDASQISKFAQQISPGDSKWVIDAFEDATESPHSYMLFDCNHYTPKNMRVRSNVLPHEFPMRTYMPKACAASASAR
jgi:hypothetical protein